MSSIQVLGKALRVLEVLAEEKSGVSLGFLSKRLDLPRSTVQRIIDTLEEEGWVRKGAGDASLSPGLKSLRLGVLVNPPGSIDYIRQLLQKLQEATRETVTCARLVEGRMQILASLECTEILKVSMIPADRIPLVQSSLGKILLAFLPEKERKDYAADYQQQLTIVRRDGVAFDREECAAGICSAAIHIPLPGHETLAFAILAPASRYYQQETSYIHALKSLLV